MLFCHLIETCIFVGLIQVETAGLITMDMAVGILLISYLLLGIPLLTAFIRRLHDTGHSAWSLLWLFVPYLGWFILLIRALKPGYTYAISRDYNDDLDCVDYDSAGNRISKPRYEECFDHNDEEDFDYPTDEEDDYENERRRRREEREEFTGCKQCGNCKHRNWFGSYCTRTNENENVDPSESGCVWWEWNGKEW